MNNKAVVLAADSASTVSPIGKVYNADKLFRLRNDAPIGIMVYANAEYAGIPWETFIKTYAADKSREEQSTVLEYVGDFLDHVRKLSKGGETGEGGGYSGIIVAGFGKIELRPTLVAVRVAQEDDELVAQLNEFKDFEADDLRNELLPFAQSEMVHRFRDGIDPELLEIVWSRSARDMASFAKDVSDLLPTGDYDDKIAKLAKKRAKRFKKRLKRHIKKNYRTPIVKMIRSLPKEELADLAESLVGMTALKRRVAPELETVGGPIDVAIITKGDGFVWYKREADHRHRTQSR